VAFGEGGIQYTFTRTLCIATYHLDTFLVAVLASDLISAICILNPSSHGEPSLLLFLIGRFVGDRADHGGRRCGMTSIPTLLRKPCDYLIRYSIADASVCEEKMSCSVACR
jgi:hypothetical protein